MNCPNCGYVLNPNQSCRGKQKFESIRSAENQVKQMKNGKKGKLGFFDGLRPYQCNFCGKVHLGHKPSVAVKKIS